MKRRRRRSSAHLGALALTAMLLVVAGASLAQSGGAAPAPSALAAPFGSAPAQPAPAPTAPTAGDAGNQAVWDSCTEFVPKGATRPRLETHLPSRGMSGYAVDLVVIVTHGAGETVMPGGFSLNRASDAMLALVAAQWRIPDPDGGSSPQIDRPDPDSDSKTVTSTLSLPFVPLPDKPGRHRLRLPPIPITVARASGEIMTLCTGPRSIMVDDPIANEPDPQVRPNPPPRPQRETWVFAQKVAMGLLAALLLIALGAWLMRYLARKPRVVPPKAKLLPWIAAVRELESIQASTLLADEEYAEFIDRVDDCTRRYLGDRYGFDGLESTSEEIRRLLKRVYPPLRNRDEIEEFLVDTDLFKYAKVTPTAENCDVALSRAFEIVRATTPPNAVRIDVDGPPTRRKVA